MLNRASSAPPSDSAEVDLPTIKNEEPVFISKYLILLKKLAERTGLEPAAFRVTGGRYNQLNYLSAVSDNCEGKN